MTNEEAKSMLNLYASMTMMTAMNNPSNESLVKMNKQVLEAVKIACDAIDIVSERLELENKEDEGDN